MSTLGLSPIWAHQGWSPASEALGGWWEANFTGAPWLGTPSAGTSGSASRSLTQPSFPPSIGASVNGYTPAEFDGVNDHLAAGLTSLTSLASNTAYSIAILIWADTAAHTSQTSNLITTNNAGTSSISAGLWDNAGTKTITISHYQNTGSAVTHAATITLGAWQLVQIRYNGTNLGLRLNGGAWSEVAAAPLNIGSLHTGIESLFVGWGNLQAYFDGKLLALLMAPSAFSDATFDLIRDYCNRRYNISV